MRVNRPLILLLLLSLAGAGEEPPRIDGPWSDHMVVPRGVGIPLRGQAGPGRTVTLAFRNTVLETRADDRGRWTLHLPAQEADSTPSELVLRAGTVERRLRDLLVGEVWLCAGQSNMEFPLARERTWDRVRAEAGQPAVRCLNFRHAGQGVANAPYPAEDLARLTPEEFLDRAAWTRAEPSAAAGFSAVAWFFGHELQRRLGVPVGIVHAAVGGSPAEAWISRERLLALPDWRATATGPWPAWTTLEPWCVERARIHLGGRDSPAGAHGPHHPYEPGFLREALDARLAGFPCHGLAWYQGESNALAHPGAADPAWRVRQHERLFPALVEDWRERLGRPGLPVLTCQLSGIRTNAYASAFWPEFRDGQRRLADALPGVGLVVTSDLGHPTDVHPREKREIGLRLASLALLEVYGLPGPLPCPEPVAATRHEDGLRVTFRHAGAGLILNEPPGEPAFHLAGQDGVFHPAAAVPAGNEVRLRSPAVPRPLRVRHAWAPFPTAHLCNEAGRPCGTFELTVAVE